MRLDLYEQGGYTSGGISVNGGNISGPLILAGNPSQTLEAVPKQYVDAYFNSVNAANFTAGTLPAARLPGLTGDLTTTQGGSTFTLGNSGVVAGSYGKVTVNAKGIVTGGSNLTDADIPFGVDWTKINSNTLPTTLNGYGILDGVSSAGGTLTGFLMLSQSPSSNTQAATKQYVDSLVSGGGIAVGDILRKPYSATPSGFLKCNGGEVDKTTYANLYAVIGDNYKNNYLRGAGQPWKQQYDITKANNGVNLNWAAETATMPDAMAFAQVIVTKNRVYVLGYYSNTANNATIYTAPINADGSLGTWASSGTIPVALRSASVVVIKSNVYLLGGYTGSYITTVYKATIASDGTIGAWTTGVSLPGGIATAAAFVTKSRLYLCGGTDGTVKSVVYSAPVNSDGSLGSWVTETNSLPSAVAQAEPVVTNNRVYLLGGTDGTNFLTTVHTAAINSDGTVGTWSVSTSLPVGMSLIQAFTTNNRVYITCGQNAAGTLVSYSAQVNSDGTLGTWVIANGLPVVYFASSVIATSNRVYLLGGRIGTQHYSTVYSAPINGGLNDYSAYYAEDALNYMMPGSGKPWQQQYQINTTQSGDITGWTTGTALPIGIGQTPIVVTKNRVYILGGYSSGAAISAIYTAAINTDGTLGAWSTNSNLPVSIFGGQAVTIKNKVYLFGGWTSSTVSTVYFASINADGTLGAWSTGTSLPVGLNGSTAVVTKNRVYLIGGHNGSAYVASTYSAPINSDGTLGTWIDGTSVPEIVGYAQTIITKNIIYLFGGYTTAAWSGVYTAPIDGNGFIGTWTLANSQPGALGYSQSIVTKNRVYLLGGNYGGTGSTVTNTIYSAPINVDGMLGTWVSSGTINTSTYGSCGAFIANNKVYIIGGYTGPGNPSGVVQMATISDGLNDYSPYYDGTITGVDFVPAVNTKFILPDFTGDEPFGSYSYIKF